MQRCLAGAIFLAFTTSSVADTTLNDGTVLADTPAWIVTYIEVAADAVDEASTLINEHVDRSQSEKGNLRFEGLQRIGRDNHFAILEAWSDPAARAVHAASAHSLSFRETLQPLLYAPYDERPHVGLEAAAPNAIPEGDTATVYVLTHADIIPPEQFAPCNRRPEPNGPCGNKLLRNLASSSRTHAGNIRFDVLTQANRANHMTVVEMWENALSQAAHQTHVEKKGFRDELAGIEAGASVNADPQFVPDMLTGSLWDERLYRLIAR